MISTLLAFALTLGLLIVIHEYGHYRVAVACGVKVLRFSVGFGPVIWRWQRGAQGTEFVLSAVPLGGYVKMLDEREAPVPPDQRTMTYNNKPLWQRSAIVAAGPAANLLLAVLLYAGVHWIGMQEFKAVLGSPPAASVAEQAGLRAGDWVRAASFDGNAWTDLESMSDLRWHVTQGALRGSPLYLMVSDRFGHAERRVALSLQSLDAADMDSKLMSRLGLGQPFSEPVMGAVKPGGPAEQAGMQSGDRVLSVNGEPIVDAAHLLSLIRKAVPGAEGSSMIWRIERQGQAMTLNITPTSVLEGDLRVGRIEAFIGSAPEQVTVRYGFVDGLGRAAERTWDMSVLTIKMLGQMITGQASLKNLSGPLTMADYAGQSARLGLPYYLGFLAIVSVSLGVLNLLPLPMLDGGHLMYHLFEALTGRPVSELWLERLQRGGVAIILMMMSLALYNDVARLFGFH